MTGAQAPAADGLAATACDACLRRSWLLGRLAGTIEIARHTKALPEVLALDDETLIAAVCGRTRAEVLAWWAALDLDAARAATHTAGLAAVCRHDARYPPRLLGPGDAPAALFVGGRLQRLDAFADEHERIVAIVGARRASTEGEAVARALARDLALAGVPVVSGMALGIDSVAQAAALDAGGLSVAVLGGGPDRPYPASKAHLHRRLLERGLVVAELPPGTRPRRWTFPARNRIIAGLADVVVVVEAAERSGSLITADLALRLGREVAAVPGSAASPRAAGSNGLLREGATLVRDARDVLDVLFGAGGAPALRRVGGPELEPPLARVLEAVAGGRDTVAALAAVGPPADVLVALTELELRGLVDRRPGGRYAPTL